MSGMLAESRLAAASAAPDWARFEIYLQGS
jgi:hypothetical protein